MLLFGVRITIDAVVPPPASSAKEPLYMVNIFALRNKTTFDIA